MGKDYDDAEEIDLMECLYLIRKHIIIILLAGVVFCFVGGLYAYIYVPVTYTSSTSILVLSKESISTSIEDLEFGAQLVSDYQELITSKAVLTQVKEEMSLGMSMDLLNSCIRVENPENTRLLYLYVTCEDPQLAKDIVNKLTEVSALYVADKMEVDIPKVIDQGEMPLTTNENNVYKYAGIGFLCGMVISSVIILFLNLKFDNIKTEDDISNFLSTSILASIPNRKKLKQNQQLFYQEAIKRLRLNVLLPENNCKSILVTSCFPGEGKSEIIFQLGIKLSCYGKKVILIDVDIPNSSSLSTYISTQNKHGISEYLNCEVEKENIICSTEYENLDIIFSGSASLTSSELLGNSRFEELMVHLTNQYDFLLIDTPPISVKTDSVMIATLCDGAILIFESELVNGNIAKKAKQQLEESGCKILGAVLNKTDPKREQSYSLWNKRSKRGV